MRCALCDYLLTLSIWTTSGGNCMSAVRETLRYIRSTNMPARIACATVRNFGFSSVRRRVVADCRVKVEANHSRTSGGTASGCTSDNSSSSSARRLFTWGKWSDGLNGKGIWWKRENNKKLLVYACTNEFASKSKIYNKKKKFFTIFNVIKVNTQQQKRNEKN